jgi:hypothetical protein
MFLLFESTNISALRDITLLRKSFLVRDITLLRKSFLLRDITLLRKSFLLRDLTLPQKRFLPETHLLQKCFLPDRLNCVAVGSM